MMTEDQRQRIADGWIDFVGGKWISLGKRDGHGIYREGHKGERIYK
jgi:hypothetical protein